jgi:RNA recognition motif-containing protein
MAQKLFIGGLAFSTSTERLREVFAAAGQVESAAVVTDRETGRSRGFGFVEMATAEEADQAITQFNGKNLDGRQLRVEKASASGGGGGGRTSRGFGGGGGSSHGGRW